MSGLSSGILKSMMNRQVVLDHVYVPKWMELLSCDWLIRYLYGTFIVKKSDSFIH